MSAKIKDNSNKKLILFVSGSLALIVGITLVLLWWVDVVRLFRGAGGMALALAGLLMLYSLREL